MINIPILRRCAISVLLFISTALLFITLTVSAEEKQYPNLPETDTEYLSINSPKGQIKGYDFCTKDADIAQYILHYLNSLPMLDEKDVIVPTGYGLEMEFVSHNKLYLYSLYPIKTLCLTVVGINVDGIFAVSAQDLTAFTEMIKGFSNGTLHIDGFRGVPSEWAKTDTDFLIQNSVLERKHRVCYDSSVTRLEFCEIISALINDTENAESHVFEDTENEKVNLLHSVGIIYGTDETHFSPFSYLTREQAAVILGRLLRLNAAPQTENPIENINLSFSDSDDVSEWALKSVALLSDSGILKGYDDGRFYPKEKITKEEAIVMIARMYRFLNT